MSQAEPTPAERGSFSKLGFVFAAAGSAVGLGNLLKFPAVTSENGGGAFVLIYLGAVLLVGLPLMFSELIIGNRGESGLFGAARNLTRHSKFAGYLFGGSAGLLAVVTCCLFLSFYSVLGGWVIHYLFGSMGAFEVAADGAFERLQTNFPMSATWHSLFMVMTVFVVARGVSGGIEKLCNILMPALFLFLFGLLAYTGYKGGLSEAVTYLFKPDFSKVTGETALQAIGQAFFSLSLGMGTMVIYGSYMKRQAGKSPIVQDGLAVVGLDTLVALLGGLVVFAVIYGFGGEPSKGGGLGILFVTLTKLFADLGTLGNVLGVVFFLLALFAAWSSSVSLLEVPTGFLVDELGVSRRTAAITFGVAVWAVGMGCAYDAVNETATIDGKEEVIRVAMFNQVDSVVSLYLLPVGGILVALLVGYLLKPADRDDPFNDAAGERSAMGNAWLWTTRIVTPALVVVVILWKLGVIDLKSEETPPAATSQGE